ncbi:primosomal protein N' [Hazenella coriacea]|uniref:Replication restart protein PriA n=1 Tax=Hazenella coriacea TaxID=1179467 RepID=A0A4R3L1Q9_9BACL|nr:primosomal protein N' [Hazenella coriacea]TCS93072.1 replication restart DNA helicase PriA [Hazenella coriacea]
MPTNHSIAEVIVDVPTSQTDRPFDYMIPDELKAEVQVGSRVQVPFGPRTVIGYVVNIKAESSNQRLKSIQDVLDILPPLTHELVELGHFMADEYICHTITALQSMIPAVLKGKYEKVIQLHPEDQSQEETLLTLSAHALFEQLRQTGECSWEEALRLPGIHRTLLQELKEAKKISWTEKVGDRVTKQKVIWVLPTDKQDLVKALEQCSPRATRQREILHFFMGRPEEISLPELLTQLQTTRSTVKRLVEQGWLCWEEREQYRDPFSSHMFTPSLPLPLTVEQQQAFDSMIQPIREHQFASILLHGVTGSGKTEIYLQTISEVLDDGREAIVLVPEISLTPQMVNRFKGRFGNQVAVLHSGLSSGERFDEWRKIRRGEVKVAIGARSAIFAPFQQLGLIIIDEEHESSYKQEENPKYHAREIAKWRAQFHQATLILGSATPALETYHAAQIGDCQRVTLLERVQGRPFPKMQIVDMREEMQKGNRSMFSTILKEELIRTVDRGEQVVLFLNRRGFSTFVMCRECGESLMCPHCDISLTYHHTNRSVRCHYCGYAESVPKNCPVCESQHIRYFGTGTQRVEEELGRSFPGLRVIRMDVDTTGRKGSHEKLLSAFGAGQADVLLGTQMIAKGLDFPKVTLVGVIAADTMLHLPDFRAAERTFQLITQVSGRAGRHEHPGKVVIQTYDVDHYSIQLAAKQQIERFYQQESQVRKRHRYPPFCGLVTILLSHPDRLILMKVGQEMGSLIQQRLPDNSDLLGPVPAPIPRIKDRYRLQILIKYDPTIEKTNWMKQLLKPLPVRFDDPQLRVSIDHETTRH